MNQYLIITQQTESTGLLCSLQESFLADKLVIRAKSNVATHQRVSHTDVFTANKSLSGRVYLAAASGAKIET